MITKDTIIGDIVTKHPEVIDVLLGYGLHCIGCGANQFESLEDGFKVHGMSNEDIDEAVQILNETVEKNKRMQVQKPEDFTITITENAENKIKEFCQTKHKQALRLSIKKGGCSGFSYLFDLAEEKNNNEIVIEQHGVKVYIDQPSLEKLNGATLDYHDALTGAGFKIQNPMAKKSCGCGSSVGF